MKKRALIIVLALILPLCFLLCSCDKVTLKYDPKPMPVASPSGARLTGAEYEAGLKRSLSEKYTKNLLKIADLMENNGSSKASEIKKYADEANSMLDTMEQAITEILAMNPPQELDNMHKVLINSLKLEWEWIQLHRALFSSRTNADVKSLDKEFDLWNAKCDAAVAHNESYTSVYIEIVKQLKTMT